jgi:uncharacterized membrane protein YkgB
MINAIVGLSMRGSISLGMVLVAGRKRVPYPAATIRPFIKYSFLS